MEAHASSDITVQQSAFDLHIIHDSDDSLNTESTNDLSLSQGFEVHYAHLTQAHYSPVTLATIQNSSYPYTSDLLELDSYRIDPPLFNPVPGIMTVSSPLVAEAWEKALRDHPDQRLAGYLVAGIQQGFRIGFNADTHLRATTSNMPSTREHPGVVTNYLTQELQCHRVIGPLQPNLYTEVIHTNCFGVIPKRHQQGKWRLILDLSFPPNHSVNTGIDRHLSSLQYATVDDAARIVSDLGPDSQMAKVDIAHAYRNIPVHPQDRHLLGMLWANHLYVDTVLPFGLRSAPKIFCAVSDAMEWILQKRGITSCLHYIDDFITFGAANSPQCSDNLQLIIATCQELGLPLQAEKLEKPTTVIIFLGIEFNSTNMTMKLPDEKKVRLQQLIDTWLHTRRAARKREMLSLIGELAHACKVVRPGRTFLRRMIDLASSRQGLEDWIRINQEFKSDLTWWSLFLDQWNGVSLLQSHLSRPPDTHVFTDASGNWGCGSVCGNHWFKAQWSDKWSTVNITTKELVPIILSVAVWGRELRAQHVLFHSDNAAVVAVIQAGSSRDSGIMHLLRCLHFFSAKHDIRTSAIHISGAQNVMADALSRNDLDKFFFSSPKALWNPTPVPEALWSLVVETQPDWLSPTWKIKLKSI